MIKSIKIIFASICLSVSFILTAYAGQSCEVGTQKTEVLNTAVSKAVKVNEYLNSIDAKIVLIARIGQDLSKYNLKYSHVAFAYKKLGDDTWQVYHELNGCGSDQSSLYVEGLANFLLDDMVSYENKIFVPSKELQDRLYDSIVTNPQESKSLHESNYNMVAMPFSTKYQNSNQWVLEIVAKSLSKDKTITNRKEAQQWLSLMGYQPTTLQVGTLTRLGGRMFKTNIAFDDHPFNRRMAGQIDTVTVDSVYEFLKKADSKGNTIEL